jgi:radical SAM superfamily enzyme YgiQ (UPF0313 family)
MKLLFILPAVGRKEGEEYIETWMMEPLMVATLKALTPPDVETFFFDDRVEEMDYTITVDIAAITVEAYTASRAYKIAKRFRERGITIIMGGYHVTAVPEEALEHCDSIIVGNAENVWKTALRDFQNGNLRQRYDGGRSGIPPIPDRSIYGGKKYLPLTLIETGRGCPHTCEFCAITSYYCGRYTPRPVDDIVAEITHTKNKFVFFVDDNITARREHLLTICKAVTPLKIKWVSQVSLAIAKDDEVLQTMKKSGCVLVLIGFESLDKANLDQMNKSWSYKLGEHDELVRKIHRMGISIYATFVFGFDFDNAESFDDTVKFAMKHKFFFAAFNHLLPFPGTPLYERLQKENRFLYAKWWLKDGYKYGDIPFQPKTISPGELKDYCANARRRFFKMSNIIRRGIVSFTRTANPFATILFFRHNMALGKEVDRKLNLPVGTGLD